MRGRTAAGLACLLIGALLLSGAIQLSTAPELYCSVTPDGSQDAPSIFTPNQPIDLKVHTTSAGLPHPQYWSVTVAISWTGASSGGTTIDLGNYISVKTVPLYEGGTRVYYTFTDWTTQWTPQYYGTEYILRWKVEVKDSSGNLVKTYTETTYGMTLDEHPDEPIPTPDGVFKVNNVEVPSDVPIITLTGTYNVYFTPTENGNYIDHLRICAGHSSTGNQMEDNIYESDLGDRYASFEELPEGQYGQYEIRCYIVPVIGDDIYKGSVIIDYQEWTPPPTPGPEPPEISGYLEINWDRVENGSSIVSGPEVTFLFVPTDGQDAIKTVYVELTNSTGGKAKVELVKQDDGSYGVVCAAPDLGEYGLKLFVEPVGCDPVQLLSAKLMIIDEEPSSWISLSHMLGIALIGAGAIMALTGRKA